MKKKIFILSQWMNIGGIESSLVSLLKELDYSKNDVDLCLIHHVGPWMNEIPQEVRLLPPDRRISRVGMGLATAWKQYDWLAWSLTQLARYLSFFYYRLFRRCKVDEIGFGQISSCIKSWLLPKKICEEKYDLCLVFGSTPGFARLVEAKVKAVWIHTDWSHYKPIRFLARRQFSHVDYIVNVSEEAKKAFDSIVGELHGVQSVVIENCLSPKWVKKRSEQLKVEMGQGIKILSIGRVSAPKNFFRALEAAKILYRRHIHFTWIIVGDGEVFQSLSAEVQRSNLGDSFILAGQQPNPYPYLTWCDILVCTSDWEGKSVAVREAQMFARPVVVTKFPTALSQVEDGVDGLLVERTPEAVADGIEKLYHDKILCNFLSDNCRKRDYANIGEIDKIMSWMN